MDVQKSVIFLIISKFSYSFCHLYYFTEFISKWTYFLLSFSCQCFSLVLVQLIVCITCHLWAGLLCNLFLHVCFHSHNSFIPTWLSSIWFHFLSPSHPSCQITFPKLRLVIILVKIMYRFPTVYLIKPRFHTLTSLQYCSSFLLVFLIIFINSVSIFFSFYFLYSRFLLVISFIHISVHMSIPISQFIPPPPPPPCRFPPLLSICLLSTSVSQFLPCKLVHLYHFLGSTYMR